MKADTCVYDSLLYLEITQATSQRLDSMGKDDGCLLRVKTGTWRFGILGMQHTCRISTEQQSLTHRCPRSKANPVATRNFDNGAAINDAVMHANQGELITCDQNGAVKIWDLAAHACTHALASIPVWRVVVDERESWQEKSKKVPEEGVPMRSVTVASDGSMLVAANNKVNDRKWMKACRQSLTTSRIQGMCYVWRMSSTCSDDADIVPVKKFQAHNDYIVRCVLSPDTK